MKPENEEKVTGLPENAYRELKEGESYKPLMSPNKHYPEVTPWSVLWGLVMAVIFSAAAAYLGLKVGQVFEAAIPIAIIAVGLSSGFKRKNALGENVIIQSIGASSGVIVAGAIFTLPALYILQDKYPEITVNFFEVFMSSLLGGIIGILLLIPFRKYFVSDMHGKYPFPEATATTQVLVSGEKGGSQAKPLIFAGLIGGLYDFIIATFGWWGETISTRIVGAGEMLAEKAKIVLKVNTGAAVLGLGYIIGLKYSLIICAGSFLVWLVIIPAMSAIFSADVLTFGNDAITATVGSMSAEQIFTTYARHIGIGGIATAGVIGIINSWGIIKGAVGLAANELKGKGDAVESNTIRTQKDLSMKVITIGIIVSLIVTFLFFQFGVLHNWFHAAIGLLLVGVIAFLFTTVAANAIAIVGTNPVSGMTLMTLILASIILVAVGLKGPAGMVSALIIGGVVCTALSMAGGFITDLKIGYWLGSTPAKQETWKFLGTLVSAATVGGVILILNQTYGFTTGQLAAPQANAMAAVIEPLMSGSGAPWALYAIGVIAFLFTTVAANAIAIVGTNPVSGMTLMTLILASIILVAVGLKGPAGMVSALIIGGVVCTALSMAGGFITDLKIGYWLGSTPAKQETWKFLGTLVSAATVGGVILILNQTYGFTTGQLAAPQANAMAAVIEPLMSGSGAPWALYAIGAALAVVLNFCKIPALAFALGMFIPLDLNTPLLIGGAISWYVGSRSKDQSLNSARLEKGTLLASGFIAGGALMGVVSAALRFGGINLMNEEWASSNAAEILAVVMYLVMIAYLTFNSLNAKKE